jgi:hypothetical protein
MTRSEVDVLVDWAAKEGWNPGLHDADVFWATDPEAFVAADLEGELIGGASTTAYEGQYGFMGFFIVRPEFRGRGLGNILAHAICERMTARLEQGAPVGIDGVFDMQPYYATLGFRFSHRNIRYRLDVPDGVPAESAAAVVSLSDVPFDEVETYDRMCFPAPRRVFLERWIAQAGAQCYGLLRGGRLAGYGVVRKCGEGCKAGPLFADDGEAAEALFSALLPFAAGGPLFLDAPENNPAAIALVERHGMDAVFGCARMYLVALPQVDENRVFGVTTFELG